MSSWTHTDIRGRGETRTIANIQREDQSRSISACPSRLSRSSSISSYAHSDISAASYASSATSWCDHDESPLDSFSESTLTDWGSSTFSDFETASPEYWHLPRESHTLARTGTPPIHAVVPSAKTCTHPLSAGHVGQYASNTGLMPIGHERALLQRQRECRLRGGPPATTSLSRSTFWSAAATDRDCDHTPPLSTSQQSSFVSGTTTANGEQYHSSEQGNPSVASAPFAGTSHRDTTSLPLRTKPATEVQSAQATPVVAYCQPQARSQPRLASLQKQQQPRCLPVPLPRRQQQPQRVPVPTSQTQRPRIGTHPRRVQTDTSWNKPRLVRQEDRKDQYVNALVDVTESLVAHIWPAAAHPLRVFDKEHGPRFIHLHHFIEQLLKRTYASHCMLQVALYFCYLLSTSGALDNSSQHRNGQDWSPPYQVLHCGRRMFLASLMLSFKTLNDKNMSSRAWRNLAGLSTKDVNENEKVFMSAIDYRLFVREETYRQWAKILDYQLTCYRFGKGLDWSQAFAMMSKSRKMGSSWLESNLSSSYLFHSLPCNAGPPRLEASNPSCGFNARPVNTVEPQDGTTWQHISTGVAGHESTPCQSFPPDVEILSAGLPANAPVPSEVPETAAPSTEDIAVWQPLPESPDSTGPTAPPAPRMGTVSPPEVPLEESDGQGNWLLDIGMAGGEGCDTRQPEAVPETTEGNTGAAWINSDTWQRQDYEPAALDMDSAKHNGNFDPRKICNHDNDSGYDSSSPLSTYHAPAGRSDETSDPWQAMVVEEDPVSATCNEELHRAVRANLASGSTQCCELDCDDDLVTLRPVSEWLASERQNQKPATDAAPAFNTTQFDHPAFSTNSDNATTSVSPEQTYATATTHQQPPSAMDTTFYETHHELLEDFEASAEQQLSDRLSKKRKAAQGSLRRKGSLKATAKRVKVEREREKSRSHRPASAATARVSIDLGVCSPPTSPVEADIQ